MIVEQLTNALRDVPDFPKPGILFKDITPILGDADLFGKSIDLLAARHVGKPIDKVAAVESRGFIFGVGVARLLGAGFVPIRKSGKLPYETLEISYQLEYGEATLAIHKDAIHADENVLIVDDLLATGGTAAAAASLVEQLGGIVAGIDFLIELDFLNGRAALPEYDVCSHIHC